MVPYGIAIVRIVAGLLFWQHGLEKLFGFAGARPEPTLWAIRGVGGILETIGGPMIALGLLTRPTAFVLSGEMAVAYFRSWAPRGFFPIANGGEEATLFCFLYLWLWTAGPGAWSLDRLTRSIRGRPVQSRLVEWEPYARSILRVIVGFLLTLHGCRKLFGLLISVAGRRNAPPLAIDALPPLTGSLDLVGGVLLMLGLFVRQTAAVMTTEALLAYVLFAQPRTLWPVRNGGNEALLYAVLGVLFVMAGAGAWSIDAWRIDLRTQPERRRLRA
jgi:putative oxidoreductase